jgi:hypothetical protein
MKAMDTLRGNFDADDFADDQNDYLRDWDVAEDDNVSEAPPVAIGTDERRMQVRAYNHWASLLNERNFPSIEDLEPDNLPDFGPYSVLLDFSLGMENPGIQYLGDQLAVECGTHDEIGTLSDVPSRSLLSRITDHYMQILANQAPIGFEAEFVNQRGATILYRGILLPFSSDDEGIDFIYGVINWKEMADQQTTDELMLEIDQALEQSDDDGEEATPREPDPVTDWADGPSADDIADDIAANIGSESADDILDLGAESAYSPLIHRGSQAHNDFPAPSFGANCFDARSFDGPVLDEEQIEPLAEAENTPLDLTGSMVSPSSLTSLDLSKKAVAVPVIEDANESDEGQTDEGGNDEGLYDCLAAARELAHAARSCEDRSRSALYAAVGRAYDFSLVAQESRDEFDELVTENGLTVQERAPMTPVVKLVFGADYDKTRLTEYAAVLTHAHRMEVRRGALADFLAQAEGGLKGVVQAERQLRREESGKQGEEIDGPQERLARKLRAIEPMSFEAIESDGDEFGLVMIRRLPTGEVVMLGEITGDIPLVERAARKLIG